MSIAKLFEPLSFARGPAMKNRFMLAPLTNCQSHPDGRLSDEEFHWLTMRAEGGFGLIMTCAAHVQARGQGFPGQLGIFGDEHIEGLTRLAATIKAKGSIAAVQLHHAGNRAPKDLAGDVVCPSDDPATGARGLTLAEVEQLRDDFIAAAKRAEKAGFDGVEIHGAHGYILLEFLSPKLNRREDRYGGSLENRARIVFEIIDGIRARCRPDFQLGLRLSPERFGVNLPDIRDVAAEILRQGKIDYLDMSLWDYTIEPVRRGLQGPLADERLHRTAARRCAPRRRGQDPQRAGRDDRHRSRLRLRPDRPRRDPAPRFPRTRAPRSELPFTGASRFGRPPGATKASARNSSTICARSRASSATTPRRSRTTR